MNNNFDGFHGLYGPGPFAVLAEMARERKKAGKARSGAQDERPAWPWRHKVLLFVGGVLVIAALVAGGSGV